MNSTFSNFRLILQMQTPVVFSDFAPTLDGLLFAAISKRYTDKNHAELHSLMREMLAYNDEWGVFHASSAAMGVSDERGLVAKEYVRADALLGKLTDELFTPRLWGGKYPKIKVFGGPTKQRLSSRPAYAVPYIAFDVRGDHVAIKTLLEYYLLGVGYDAQNIRSGAFSGCIVVPLDHDTSLVSNLKANRPLPAASGIDGVRAMVRLLPPYYFGSTQEGVVPARVRAYHINILMKGFPL
ncbi:TPA: hypothetical protein ACSCYS_003498 [Aeromonas veronii]